MEPVHAFFRLADNNHFLLFKLVNPVNAPFFQTVCTNFLPEAWRIASQGLRQVAFRQNGINKFPDHGVFARTDQIEVFTFNLVHHAFHFCKAHNAGNNAAPNHERRNVIGKALVDHEIPCIVQNTGMQAGNIAAQIIETITAGLSSRINVNSVQVFHDVNVIRNREIRNNRFAKAFYFHIFAVVLANRNAFINDVRDNEHSLPNFCFQFGFFLFEFVQLCTDGSHFLLHRFCFVLFALSHQCTDFLADGLSLVPEVVTSHLGFPELLVQIQHFIYQRQFFVLKLLADVFLYQFRICPD